MLWSHTGQIQNGQLQPQSSQKALQPELKTVCASQ